MACIDFSSFFPKEIILKVLSFVPKKDFRNLFLVSKLLNRLAEDDQLWIPSGEQQNHSLFKKAVIQSAGYGNSGIVRRVVAAYRTFNQEDTSTKKKRNKDISLDRAMYIAFKRGHPLIIQSVIEEAGGLLKALSNKVCVKLAGDVDPKTSQRFFLFLLHCHRSYPGQQLDKGRIINEMIPIAATVGNQSMIKKILEINNFDPSFTIDPKKFLENFSKEEYLDTLDLIFESNNRIIIDYIINILIISKGKYELVEFIHFYQEKHGKIFVKIENVEFAIENKDMNFLTALFESDFFTNLFFNCGDNLESIHNQIDFLEEHAADQWDRAIYKFLNGLTKRFAAQTPESRDYLSCLPREVIIRIFNSVPREYFINLFLTSSFIRKMARNKLLWLPSVNSRNFKNYSVHLAMSAYYGDPTIIKAVIKEAEECETGTLSKSKRKFGAGEAFYLALKRGNPIILDTLANEVADLNKLLNKKSVKFVSREPDPDFIQRYLDFIKSDLSVFFKKEMNIKQLHILDLVPNAIAEGNIELVRHILVENNKGDPHFDIEPVAYIEAALEQSQTNFIDLIFEVENRTLIDYLIEQHAIGNQEPRNLRLIFFYQNKNNKLYFTLKNLEAAVKSENPGYLIEILDDLFTYQQFARISSNRKQLKLKLREWLQWAEANKQDKMAAMLEFYKEKLPSKKKCTVS